MRLAIGIREPWRQRHQTLPPRHFARCADAYLAGLGRQDQLRLPGTDQIDVDLGQKLGVEQRAVLGSAGIVDRIARAEVIEPVRNAGVLAPCQQQRVDQPLARDRRPLDAIELGIDEADVERGVVDHQRRVGDEFEKIADHLGKQRFARQELGGKTVHRERLGRHVALGVDVAVKGLPGRHAIENLDAADLDQPIAAQRIKAGGFGIENDFAHQRSGPGIKANQARRRGILATCCRMSRIRARTGSRPCEVSTTKSARLRFSASGSCRARMASSFSPVMLSRARMRCR